MVELYNIVLLDNLISCEYSPEHSEIWGKVLVNTDTGEIESVDYSSYEYGKKMYVAQVRAKLMKLFQAGNSIPRASTAIFF